MSQRETITNDLKDALKNKDSVKLNTLRFLMSVIKNQEIDNKKELTDDEITDIVSREIKKRKESVKLYLEGGRHELADKENEEIKILERYLPEQLSSEELETIIKSCINEIGAETKSDMGKVMSLVMSRVKGKAQGSDISLVVSKLLK